jgi:outer membrane protein OmpA-like peptidoglycan-associated protein
VLHNIFPQSIIDINGHGKTEARANDPAGRAKDRRVEIWAKKHGSTETSCW